MAGTPGNVVRLGFLGLAEIRTAELKFDANGHAVHALFEVLFGKDFFLQLNTKAAPGRSREKKNNGKAGFRRLLLSAFQALAPAEFHFRRLAALAAASLSVGTL